MKLIQKAVHILHPLAVLADQLSGSVVALREEHIARNLLRDIHQIQQVLLSVFIYIFQDLINGNPHCSPFYIHHKVRHFFSPPLFQSDAKSNENIRPGMPVSGKFLRYRLMPSRICIPHGNRT